MFAIKRCLMRKQRSMFYPEFKQQDACLVLDPGH